MMATLAFNELVAVVDTNINLDVNMEFFFWQGLGTSVEPLSIWVLSLLLHQIRSHQNLFSEAKGFVKY